MGGALGQSGIRIDFPPDLPISQRKEEIDALLRESQLIIVCGETGSGKTTQLPKMLLALSQEALRQEAAKQETLRRQTLSQHGTGGTPTDTPTKPKRAPQRLIGHTQPRRIAASSVAKRIAQELHSPLGEVVGYKVRFQDHLQPHARIKLMTDGILLAETQSDPLLRQYEAIIIDEAHERSLNIDFLLGYLRELLPKRPDLKVIITSATIDAERFAQHFASPSGKPAPVVMVSGRTYPVEQRWRPFEEASDYGLNQAIADGVDELWSSPSREGDILVFLPGEREIREAADYLRGHLQHKALTRQAEVIPLFARLSPAEQERVFAPHSERRIVLATNVAETSLTVPGIRYVIDAGTARVKRYSYRQKVEQLLVEPISQAAANQRAGRCGRVAEGICIRLYSEQDFAARPAFSDPEIVRSSLAAVILRMKSLHLTAVETFPFIDPPSGCALADGYQLLAELGAIDDNGVLTRLGKTLARLPLDPRIGRMLIEANSRGAVKEMLIIAAALSSQDVRDRPLQLQAQADQAQAQFDDEKSEFSGLLTLWYWLEGLRGQGDKRLSNRQVEQALRDKFINARRVREWRETHQQLCTIAQEQGWQLSSTPASYEQLHLSLLCGLLGNVGYKRESADKEASKGLGSFNPATGQQSKRSHEEYLGARGIKFAPHPGARLKKKPGRWIVAAELVETTRLFGRGLAHIEPQWIEQVAAGLLQKHASEPHWEKKVGQVVALQRATLYGLVVYSGRRVDYARIDPVGARELFIREALVAGTLGEDVWEAKWTAHWPFWQHNRKIVRQVEELEHKQRRQDVLVDESLIYAFYDKHLPSTIANAVEFDKWLRAEQAQHKGVLCFSKEELMRHEAAGITSDAFPKLLRLGGVDCEAQYLHEPGHLRDGISVATPLFALNQLSEARADWLVPGMLKDKIAALLKTLPQRPRSRLVPLPQSAQQAYADLEFGVGDLLEALQKWTRHKTGLEIKRSDFKPDMLAQHYWMHFRVLGDDGRLLAEGRNLPKLKAEWGSKARGAFAQLAALKAHSPATHERGGKPVSSDEVRIAARPQVAGLDNKHETAARAANPSAYSQATSLLRSDTLYTDWDFGAWSEMMEIQSGEQTLIGFPALVDAAAGVRIAVFDEEVLALAEHRKGLRRLIRLHIKDALKYLEKNIPDLQKMSMLYLNLGTQDELREQIVDVALERAFLTTPLPQSKEQFSQCISQGRARLNLISAEVARQCHAILQEYHNAQRKLKESKPPAAVAEDIKQQLGRLLPKYFVTQTAYAQLQHLPRYLKAVVVRLDKLKANPTRDEERMREIRIQENRLLREREQRKGQFDARLEELRWLIEELRVSLFAQELRTPQPVSSKRLEKMWVQLSH